MHNTKYDIVSSNVADDSKKSTYVVQRNSDQTEFKIDIQKTDEDIAFSIDPSKTNRQYKVLLKTFRFGEVVSEKVILTTKKARTTQLQFPESVGDSQFKLTSLHEGRKTDHTVDLENPGSLILDEKPNYPVKNDREFVLFKLSNKDLGTRVHAVVKF